jgi:hypothetical protein
MKATGWRGNTYGVRVGQANAVKFFSRKWKTVDIEVDGTFHTIPLSPGFLGEVSRTSERAVWPVVHPARTRTVAHAKTAAPGADAIKPKPLPPAHSQRRSTVSRLILLSLPVPVES